MAQKILTTGVVRFAPAVKLAYHIVIQRLNRSRCCAGSAIVDVEGRRYRLSPFDNVVVPPGVPHGVENLLIRRETLLHVTFPTRCAIANYSNQFTRRGTCRMIRRALRHRAWNG